MPKTYRTEIIGYKFSELSEEVKQKIYENDDFFSEMVDYSPIEDVFRENLMECFGADRDTLEVYYDISYSQGSGACCVGELDVETVVKDRVGSYFTGILNLIESGQVVIDSIRIVRCGPSNYYNHENTCKVEIEYVNDPTEINAWNIEDAEELEEMLTNAIREELLNFHSMLQDHYEESTSFEAYCDITEDHTVYTEDGKVVDPSFIKNACVIDAVQLKLDFEDHTDYNFT